MIGQEAISRQCKVHFSAAPRMLCRYLVSGVSCPVPASASFPGREKERVEICWQLVHVLFWGAWRRENISPIVQIRKHGCTGRLSR